MTQLAFLSPDEVAATVTIVSPLRDAIGAGVDDQSQLGKIHLRGSLDLVAIADDEELLRLSPSRGLLITEAGAATTALERLRRNGVRAYDMTAALAAFEIEGEDLMRRLTELDLDHLPAIGSVARGIPTVITSVGEGSYRLFVPQELGHSLVTVVLDMLRGLGR